MTDANYENDDSELDQETGPVYRAAFGAASRIWLASTADMNRRNLPTMSHDDLVRKTMTGARAGYPRRLVEMACRDVMADRQPRW